MLDYLIPGALSDSLNIHTNKLTSDLHLPSPPVFQPLPQLHLPPLLRNSPFSAPSDPTFPSFAVFQRSPPRFCAPIFRRAKQTVYISLPISSLTHVSSCCISDANRPSVSARIPPLSLQASFWFGWNLKPFNWFTNREVCKPVFPGRVLFILQCSSSLRRASPHLFSAAATSCRSPS